MVKLVINDTRVDITNAKLLLEFPVSFFINEPKYLSKPICYKYPKGAIYLLAIILIYI